MIITTSRQPTKRNRILCRELETVIPLSRYIIRGKKGMRELFSLCIEKGADRLLVVTSQRTSLSALRFFEGWTFLGEVLVCVQLRRELDIPPPTKIQGDLPFILRSSEKNAPIIASFFGALHTRERADMWMAYEDGWIDFYRLPISDQGMGPKLQVKAIHEHHN
jgi:rRNA maturation protein Rpf1